MREIRTHWIFRATAAVLAALIAGPSAPVARAASHREAPLIALDPAADLTDVYFFRSWVDPSRVVMIMNVIPGQEPSSGPNYFNFDDDVLYAFNLDINRDGKAEDIVYEVRFKTEFRGVVRDLGLPVAYAAVPPITELDGAGSEGLGLRQSYTVTEVKGHQRRKLGTGTMFAVPSNVGPRTTPNYEMLAAKGIFPLANAGRVFAGQRDETFSIDLGAVFDTVNLRRSPLPILTFDEDTNDAVNPFGVDHFSGFNINTIAIEVPISAITRDPTAVIGMYASTSRQRKRSLREDDDSHGKGGFVQVSRLANPLVNELIIGTDQKDRWNATDPKDEARFIEFYQNPRLATVLNLLFGTNFQDTDRNDLVQALLQYPGGRGRPSELLRLNLGVAPTEPADQKRLGVLAGDLAGFPNGRRPNDDVTDIALRVVAGILTSSDPGSFPRLGDGVNFNIGAPGAGTSDGLPYGAADPSNRLDVTGNGIAAEFPFLPTPHDGRNRRHIDCGEAGGNPCD